MNESFALNQSQERELLCLIYEYFLWITEQEKEKEKPSKTSNGEFTSENFTKYQRYQSAIDLLRKNFAIYESDFTSCINQGIPRLIKTLFIDFPRSHQPQKNQKRRTLDGFNDSNKHTKTKRRIEQNSNPESPVAKKKSRISNTAQATKKTNQTNAATSNMCTDNNNKNDRNDSAKVTTGKVAPSETSKSLPCSSSIKDKANAISTIDTNDDDDAGSASKNDSASKSEKKTKVPSFESRFKELEYFKAGNGHTRVPIDKSELGRWVRSIRSKKRKMDKGEACRSFLSEEQIKRLDSLGFEWNPCPKNVPFEERIQSLIKFKKAHGHVDVPNNYKDDLSLAYWVADMRRYYRQKTLSAERIKELESIGFKWRVAPRPKTFDERLEECRNYRRQHGHLKVPPPEKASCQTEEEANFVRWIEKQRYEYKRWKAGRKSSMNGTRFNALNELGLDWMYDIGEYKPMPFHKKKSRDKTPFDERLKELKAVKEKVGSCNTLQDFVQAGYTETSPMYKWVKLQRKQFKESRLAEDKVKKLQELDFDLQPRKHYAPYGSKKAAAKPQNSKELKNQHNRQEEDNHQCKEGSADDCRGNNNDETSSESDNDEENQPAKLQNDVATSAHTLFQGFGTDKYHL